MESVIISIAAFMGLGVVSLVVGAGLLFAVICAFAEKGFLATLGVGAAVAGLAYFGGVDLIAYAAEHPVQIAVGFFAYFAIGALWSVARWYFEAGNGARIYKEYKERELSNYGVDALEKLDPAQMAEYRHDAAREMCYILPLQASRNKARIMFWMGWWPVSAAGYVLDEPVKRLMNAIYARFSGLYAKIAKSQSAEFMADMGK